MGLTVTPAGASASIATPKIYHVSTQGNDTTGDGSLAKPYATLNKAITVGQATAALYKLVLSAGSFSYTVPEATATFASWCSEIQGAGNALTEVIITSNKNNQLNTNAATGANVSVRVLDCKITVYSNGGGVTEDDSTPGLVCGAGGNVTLTGNARVVLIEANGGGEIASTGANITGGAAGNITLNGLDCTAANITNTPGGGGAGNGLPGTLTAFACDMQVNGIDFGGGYHVAARSIYTALFAGGITSDLGGNAIIP